MLCFITIVYNYYIFYIISWYYNYSWRRSSLCQCRKSDSERRHGGWALLGRADIVALSGHEVPGVNGEQSGSSSLKLATGYWFKVAPRGKDLWRSLRRSPLTPWNWATTWWPRSYSEVPLRPELRSWVNMFTDAWALPVLQQRVEGLGRAGGHPSLHPHTAPNQKKQKPQGFLELWTDKPRLHLFGSDGAQCGWFHPEETSVCWWCRIMVWWRFSNAVTTPNSPPPAAVWNSSNICTILDIKGRLDIDL